MILFVPGIESSKPASPLCKMVDKGDNDKPVARDHQARHLNVLKDKRTRGGGLELRHRLHNHHNIDDHACQHRGKYGNLRVSTQFHAAQKKRSEAHSRARSAIQSAVTVDGERRHGVKDASYPLWYLGYEYRHRYETCMCNAELKPLCEHPGTHDHDPLRPRIHSITNTRERGTNDEGNVSQRAPGETRCSIASQRF